MSSSEEQSCMQTLPLWVLTQHSVSDFSISSTDTLSTCQMGLHEAEQIYEWIKAAGVLNGNRFLFVVFNDSNQGGKNLTEAQFGPKVVLLCPRLSSNVSTNASQICSDLFPPTQERIWGYLYSFTDFTPAWRNQKHPRDSRLSLTDRGVSWGAQPLHTEWDAVGLESRRNIKDSQEVRRAAVPPASTWGCVLVAHKGFVCSV